MNVLSEVILNGAMLNRVDENSTITGRGCPVIIEVPVVFGVTATSSGAELKLKKSDFIRDAKSTKQSH